MNENELRKYQKWILEISQKYQRIGMAGTLILWLGCCFFLTKSEGIIRVMFSFIFLVAVLVQYLVINKLLENKISIKLDEMKRISKSKEVRNFVFLGALVFLLRDKEIFRHPILLIIYTCLIIIFTIIIYNATSMPHSKFKV